MAILYRCNTYTWTFIIITLSLLRIFVFKRNYISFLLIIFPISLQILNIFLFPSLYGVLSGILCHLCMESQKLYQGRLEIVSPREMTFDTNMNNPPSKYILRKKSLLLWNSFRHNVGNYIHIQPERAWEVILVTK